MVAPTPHEASVYGGLSSLGAANQPPETPNVATWGNVGDANAVLRAPLLPATPAFPGGPFSGRISLASVQIPLSWAGKPCSVSVREPYPTTTRKEPSMPDNLAQELARLPRLGVADLRCRYAELFGETTGTGNKAWLLKRLAWRLQALAE